MSSNAGQLVVDFGSKWCFNEIGVVEHFAWMLTQLISRDSSYFMNDTLSIERFIVERFGYVFKRVGRTGEWRCFIYLTGDTFVLREALAFLLDLH